MLLRDSLGNHYSGATAASVEHFEHALQLLQCYIGDPLSVADQAVAAAPDMIMAHALRAWLLLLSTEAPAVPMARVSWEAASRLPATERERGHIAALEHLLQGRWHAAARTLEDVSIAHPRDVLALQLGHQLDFFTGQARMLRDRVARALPAWNGQMPGYHSLLGMQAFGLEECGDYERAESFGRRAVELEPRDGWAQHAVAHVMEMTGRKRDGINWMRANPEAWSRDSFFAVHNWWHVAMFHLDLGEIDAVFEVFDAKIAQRPTKIVLEMIDAAALLFRLELRGVDVGARWAAVADDWEPHATAGNYAFNDVHAAMAFLRAERPAALAKLLDAQAQAMAREDDNAAFTREVGAPMTRALVAFHHGHYTDAMRDLRQIRNRAAVFGGSHAQRDLLDLTILEAARRHGDTKLYAALTAERLAARPGSPWTLPVSAAA